jgi:predicted permease
MNRLAESGRRLRMLLRWRRARRELEEEMRLHRELRARGEGRAGAERRFGNELRLREQSLAVWGWSWLESLGQDVRHGLRLLARTPAATALALVSLTLGIGANTALFTLTDAMLLRSLPVKQPRQLVRITRGRRTTLTDPLWEQIRERQNAFQSEFAWGMTAFQDSRGGQSRELLGIYASGGYFGALGVSSERGRLFGRADNFHGCPAVADISDAYWRSRFGGADAAIGQAITLHGHAVIVIGVTPPGFFGMDVGTQFAVALPLCAEGRLSTHPMLGVRDAWWLQAMGRLEPGESRAEAQNKLAGVWPAILAATAPPDYTPKQKAEYLAIRLVLEPGAQGVSFLAQRYATPLEVLLGIAGLVFLIACSNLAALMLARGAARREEIAVRKALGASRPRIVRQLLTESLLLAIAGAGLGALFSVWACRTAERFWSGGVLNVRFPLTPDLRVLGFTAGLTLAAALLVGLAPALAATHLPKSAQTAERRQGRVLLAAQLAMALALLAGAGLFLRSFARLAGTPPGFDPAHIFVVQLNSPARRLSNAELLAVHERDLAFLGALPGVTSASESFMVPASGLQWDQPLHSAGDAPATTIADAFFDSVSPSYFATMRQPFLTGRDFTVSDGPNTAPVAILSESAARALFPDGHVLGREIERGEGAYRGSARVIGIVGDSTYLSLRAADPPTVYLALAQVTKPVMSTTAFELRSSLPQEALAAEVRAAFARSDPEAVFTTGTLEGSLASSIKPERLLAWLSALFGGLALLLSAIGLYGSAAYAAARRRREYGVRVALGAEPRAILRLALGEAALTAALGTGAGVVLAWLAATALRATLSRLLYHVPAADPWILAGAALLLSAAALAAAWLPARRAARADPLAALREE